MMKLLNSNRRARRGRVRSRTAALLAAAATFVGATAIGALPVQAAAPTFDISPNPSTTVEIDMPWVDRVHYTIGIGEDQDFWLYLGITLVAGNGPVLTRLSSSHLDEDNRFYLEDHDADGAAVAWGGLYLQPVDASLVDDGQTEWVLAGTLDVWSQAKGPYLYAGTQTGITDRDSSDLARQSITVQATQSNTYMNATSAEVGRDLSSVEVTYDQDLLAEDLSFGGSQYSATPQLSDVTVRPSSSMSGSNPDSVEIDGRKLIARFDTPFSAADLNSLVIDVNNSNSYGPYNGSLRQSSPGVYGLTVDAPSTTAPALDGDTAPVVSADGEELTLTFDYALASATPAVDTLTVTAGDVEVAVASIANDGATSVLTLASAISEGAAVTVAYDAPASGGYQDAAGNLVADFTNDEVTNNSTVAASATTTTTPAASDDDNASNDDSASSDTTTTTEAGSTTTNTTPSLVTEENQAALTATPGSAKALVNGEEVDLTVINAGNTTAGDTAPEQRTAEQVTELQEAADSLIENLDEAAGGDSGLTVVDTDTGAEIEGIFDDARVPVEDVIVAETEEVAGLYASRDADGNVNKIRAELLETERGGEVAVYIYGLPAGEEAELVLMSTPYLLATATADGSGNFSQVVSAPETVLAGDHTLVTASGTFSVSLGLRITEPEVADTVLPATGGGFPMAPVLFIIGLGSMMLVLTRRQESMGN